MKSMAHLSKNLFSSIQSLVLNPCFFPRAGILVSDVDLLHGEGVAKLDDFPFTPQMVFQRQRGFSTGSLRGPKILRRAQIHPRIHRFDGTINIDSFFNPIVPEEKS